MKHVFTLNPWSSVKHAQINQTWLYVWGSEYNVITESQANSKCKEGTRVSFITDPDKIMMVASFIILSIKIRNCRITEMTAFPCVFFLIPSTLFPRTKYTDKTRHDFKAPLGFTLCTGHTMSGFEVNKTTHAMQKKKTTTGKQTD